MPDWDAPLDFAPRIGADQRCITPWHLAALGAYGCTIAGVGAAAWPVANLAIIVPFRLTEEHRVSGVWWFNGTTIGGNADLAIHDRNGKRLYSTGSTAQAVANAQQLIALGSPLALPPGLYTMTLAVDSATAQLQRSVTSTWLPAALGVAQQLSAFPIPDPLVPAAYGAHAYIPPIGLNV